MEMESVSDVKATVTGDAETESVDYDVTGDAETDSISSETETESVSSEIDTESLEDMTENKSLCHINLDLESPLSTPVNDAANEVTTLKTVRANLAAKEAAFGEADAAKAAFLFNTGLNTTPTVSSQLGLNQVTYPNSAIVSLFSLVSLVLLLV